MTLPAVFPDWLPGWAQLVAAIVVILLGLAFLLMPFSVFGVKARLEAVEERLDEIQAELRRLSMRLPEPERAPVVLPESPSRDRLRDRDRPPREEPRLR